MKITHRRKPIHASQQIRANTNIDDIEFIMFKYIDAAPGIDVVGHDGNIFDVVCKGIQVRIEFDTDAPAQYAYTLDGEGPYEHNSYEFIAGDIYNFVEDAVYDDEDEEYEAEDIEVVESAEDVDDSDDDDFDRRWDEHFGEPTTEVFTADEFDKWMQDVINFDIDEPVNCAEDADDSDDIDLETGPQEFTSERTSINVNKVPAVFRLVSNWRPGTINLDYGGGRADTAADYLSQYDATNLVYDPYNRTAEHNKEVIKLIREHGGADTATCSNVLNVIKEPEVRKNVLENIKKLVKPSGTVYITVYEGSGRGDEGPTKSGYQLNRKTADYLEEIQQVFPDATRKGKLIVAHPTGSANSAIKCAADFSMIDKIQNKLEAAVVEFMTSADIGYTEDEAKDYTVVEVEEYESKWSGPSIKCEVRAELSFNSMMDLLEKLNPIVEQYNRNSYFDMEDAGIATAYIPVDSVESAVNCSTVVAAFGVDADETEDGFVESVDVHFDTDISVYTDTETPGGFVELVDDSAKWLSQILTDDELVSSYDPRFVLSDAEGVELAVTDAIKYALPDDLDSGIYHVTGVVTLRYQVSGIIRQGYWQTDDEYGYDERIDDATAELLDYDVKDFTYDYVREYYDDVDSATNTCNIGAKPDMLDLK